MQSNLVYVPFISLGMELLSMEILLQCSLPALDPATVSCAVWIAKTSSNVSSYVDLLHKIISYQIFSRNGLECSEACKANCYDTANFDIILLILLVCTIANITGYRSYLVWTCMCNQSLFQLSYLFSRNVVHMYR